MEETAEGHDAYKEEVRSRLVSSLRRPGEHQEGPASIIMLEAASFLRDYGNEDDEDLIKKLQKPSNHLQENLTMVMLEAAERLKQMS